uniref:Protein lap4 n=1 Tax=Anthurium amnicola TaxID=1678845 RepID=A0A1D1ZDC0_9ARAE
MFLFKKTIHRLGCITCVGIDPLQLFKENEGPVYLPPVVVLNPPVAAPSSLLGSCVSSSPSSSSPSPSSNQVPINNGDETSTPKVKKSISITNLFRRFSYKRKTERKENSSSTVVEATQRNSNNFSTVPTPKSPRRKYSFGSLIERLTGRFTSEQRTTSESESTEQISQTNSTENNTDTNNNQIKKADNKLKQKELVVEGQDLTASSHTLCPDESSVSTQRSTQSTAAETLDSRNKDDNLENFINMNIDVASPLRHSIAKSSNSSERADDDTIKGVSGTIRHSRIFDMFTVKKDNPRASIVNSNQMTNGVSSRHTRVNSNNMKDSFFVNNNNNNSANMISQFSPPKNSSPLSSNSYKPYNTDNNTGKSETENKNITSREVVIDDKTKIDKSPLRLFKKKFYKTLRPSNFISDSEDIKKNTKNEETLNIVPTISSPLTTNYYESGSTNELLPVNNNDLYPEEESEDSDSDKDLDDMTLDDGVEGDVSATQSQAPESSLYTGSENEVSHQLSRMSSFAKSFNSEDPSAFSTTFSDSQVNDSKLDWPIESAWDIILNSEPATTKDRKGPARFSNNRLSYIPNQFFEGLHNLKELYLDKNSLRDLPEELLKLTKLEILDLSNNCISEFHPRLKFRRMRNLRSINLDNNVLSDITSITKLKTLRELRAINNLLGSLTPDISKLTKLRLLYLDNNQLTSLPDSIGRLKSLCVLRLNNNNIGGLPAAICSLHQLQVLELRANLLSSLPENIKELENLAKLDISNNKLTSLPNELVKCSRLTHLNAHNNLLESIPAKFGQLSRLLTLNLRENRLNNLPADIGKLTSLTELDLSHNEFIVLPEDLGKLTKLTEIKLNNNPSLLTIPDSFQKLVLIRKIHLQHCSLSQIQFEMGVVYNQLTYVNLSYNHFDTMPNLQGMDHVISFNISNNRINDITEQIDQLVMLRELYVVNNKLTHIPKTIGRLKELEIMDVSENILVDLPLSIGDCVNLRELRLRGNSIETLPVTLGKLTNLNVFYIGQWPSNGFNVTQDDKNQDVKISSKIPQQVERNLLWRMHDSILKRLRDIDNNDGASESLQSPPNESNNSQQDVISHPPSPSPSPPLSRDDAILKMAVLYDQLMRDMRSNDYDKESSGDDMTEFPEIGKKKKFAKLKEFKFLKIGDKQ